VAQNEWHRFLSSLYPGRDYSGSTIGHPCNEIPVDGIDSLTSLQVSFDTQDFLRVSFTEKHRLEKGYIGKHTGLTTPVTFAQLLEEGSLGLRNPIENSAGLV